MKKLILICFLGVAAFSVSAQTKINPAKLLQGQSGGGSMFLKTDNSGAVSFSNNLNGSVVSGAGNAVLSGDLVNLGQADSRYALSSVVSGTPNYLPIFTSSNQIGNSVLFQSSDGRLGINGLPLTGESKLTLRGGHGNTRLDLFYNGDGTPAFEAMLSLWASEPNISYNGVGIGSNIQHYDGTASFVRKNTTLAGAYMRFDQGGNIDFKTISSSGVSYNQLTLNNNGSFATFAGAITTGGEIVANTGSIRTLSGIIQSSHSSSEGGSLSVLNPTKTGAIARDWRIYNMTGAYGNGLSFWSYNQSGTGGGRTLNINDDGTIDAVRGTITANDATAARHLVNRQTADARYLGISATAINATQLNSQAASYYLDYNNLSNKPTYFAPAAHVHTGIDITSGTIPDSRLSENVVIKNQLAYEQLASDSEANLNNLTNPSVRNLAKSGHSAMLRTSVVGGSTAVVQEEITYNGSNRFRTKVDNTTWGNWFNIVSTTTPQFGLTGNILTSDNFYAQTGYTYMQKTGNVDNGDTYWNARVIRNSNSTSSNDGMFIGYGNSNNGITRIFGGGATGGGLQVNGSGVNDVSIAGYTAFHQGNYNMINLGSMSLGTLADARLSSNVALKSVSNEFINRQLINNGSQSSSFIDSYSSLLVRGSHVNSRFDLFYDGGGVVANESLLSLWASEPNVSFQGAGIGRNIKHYDGTSGLIRKNTDQTAEYIRFISGQIQFKSINTAGVISTPLILNGSNAAFGGDVNANGIYANSGILRTNSAAAEGGNVSIYNSTKTGATAIDWRIYNMTGGYGNSLVFWSYNQSGVGGGRTLNINDDGTIDVTRGTISANNATTARHLVNLQTADARYLQTDATAANSGALNGQNGFYYRNASNINAGTLSDAQLSANVPRLNADNAFSGNMAIGGAINSSYKLSVMGSVNISVGLNVANSIIANSLNVSGAATNNSNSQLWTVGTGGALEKMNISLLPFEPLGYVAKYSPHTVSAFTADIGGGVLKHILTLDCENFYMRTFRVNLSNVSSLGARITLTNAKPGGQYTINYFNGNGNNIFYEQAKKQDGTTDFGTFSISGMATHRFSYDQLTGTGFIQAF